MDSQAQPLNPATILVIEDDTATGEFYADLLESVGYQVLGATSGQAALANLAVQSVKGVLLDRRLPDMDGVHLCHEMRHQIASNVPIVFITADHDPTLEAAARAAGASDFLAKPFELDEFLEKVAALIPVSILQARTR